MLRRVREWYGDFAIVWLNACLLFLVLNLVLAGIQGDPRPTLGMAALRRATLPRALPHLDAAAIERLIEETRRSIQYEPYTDMTDPPLRGRFVNVDAAGFRWSKDQGPWPPDPRGRSVFVFGGSTTFGYGVPDENTIASYLQSRLAEAAGPTHVYNFGHSGYYSTQERILFERLLVAGHVPDLAIFIDGLNDFSAVRDEPDTAKRLAEGFQTAEAPLRAVVQAIPLTTTVRHAGRVLGLVVPETEQWPAYDDVAHLRTVLDRYRRSKRAIAGVAAAFGVRTLFVWQPVPSYKFPPDAAGRWLSGGGAGWARHGYPLLASTLAGAPLGADFVWCADVSADGTEEFYVDGVHYAPVLAERIARCIADAVLAPPPAVP
jgi:hypothetical protein